MVLLKSVSEMMAVAEGARRQRAEFSGGGLMEGCENSVTVKISNKLRMFVCRRWSTLESMPSMTMWSLETVSLANYFLK